MPRPRCAFRSLALFSALLYFLEDEKEQNGTPPVSVFLPVRWIEYSSEDQVIPGKQDYDESICQEQKSDREQFQYFLKFVESQGAPLDKEKAHFVWKKDVDPHDDWITVSLILTCSVLLLKGLCVLSSIETTVPWKRSFRALFLLRFSSVIPHFKLINNISRYVLTCSFLIYEYGSWDQYTDVGYYINDARIDLTSLDDCYTFEQIGRPSTE
jgi:hypothetical protein